MATTPAFVSVGRHWNSLERLKAALVFLVILDLLFMAALFAAANIHKSQMQTIGRDAAPSIIAAQHIKVAIADMDAEVANELLAKPGEGAAAVKAYNTRRQEAAEALISAAQNITYGDAERIPIKELQVGLGEYEIKTQRARDFHERNDPQALAIYHEASSIVDNKLLPAADALDKANFDVLENTFESDSSVATEARIAVVLTGLLLLGLLAYIQWDLTSRVRRLLNPGLVVATLLTFGLLLFGMRHLSTAAEDLRVAKQDAFTSLHALWQARALAYSANADESKYLLQKDAYLEQNSFFRKAAKIWGKADHQFYTPHSYLEEESANITFAGEQAAVDQTLKYWQGYLNIDSQIRLLKNTGDYDAAIRLCLGRNQGQSDWAFSRFDDALGNTIQINQQAFDDSVASGFEQLAQFNLTAAIGTAAIAICCTLGLLVRIREFL